MEEDGLADAFRTGSAEGFRAVYERYSGAVYAIALRDRSVTANWPRTAVRGHVPERRWRACGSSDAPDAASADAARRLRALLAEPDSWAEPPAGLLDEILAGIDSERVGLVRPAAGRDGRRRQIHIRRTVRAGATALLAAAAIVIGLVVTRGPATSDVALAGTRLAQPEDGNPASSGQVVLTNHPADVSRLTSDGGGRGAAPLLSQVTVKAVPPVSAEGVASVTSLADTMVRAPGFSLPIAVLSTVALVKLTVPKFDSGSTAPVPSLGASAITSADPSCAVRAPYRIEDTRTACSRSGWSPGSSPGSSPSASA